MRKTPNRTAAAKPGASGRGRIRELVPICLAFVAGALAVWTVAQFVRAKPRAGPSGPAGSSTTAALPDLRKLVGRWQRPDGGYVLSIDRVGEDGRVVVTYTNPQPIHVAASEALVQAGQIVLYIELRDVGYPGSTYNLRYDAGRDILVGVYYQATIRQSFNVVFTRVRAR